MKIIFKILLLISGAFLFVLIIYAVTILAAFGGFDKDYSVTELKEEFDIHRNEINSAISYYNTIVPKDKIVEIEFDGDKIVRFGIEHVDKKNIQRSELLVWDLNLKSQKVSALISTLGWNASTLVLLRKKLNDANCIGIQNGEPTKVEFQRSGLGMYSFNVFKEPIKDKNQYNDGCVYRLVNETLALEYGGGAIGSQCFYKTD